jgi:hypothetical protein
MATRHIVTKQDVQGAEYQSLINTFQDLYNLIYSLQLTVEEITAMATSKKRLVGPLGVSDEPVVLYTVPVNTKTEITQIHVFNKGADDALYLKIANEFLFRAFPVLALSALDPAVGYVLNAGETIQAYSDNGSGNLIVTISGEEITL